MKKRILFTGGGTLGPVTPLLAIARELRKINSDLEMFWLGTDTGPERALVESSHIHFFSVSTPKFDRDRWWLLPLIPLKMAKALWQAKRLLKKIKPDLIFTAGGYVGVPAIWLAALQKIPVWVHQLDVIPGLANKIVAPFATSISVTWPDSKVYFSSKKTIVVGGITRSLPENIQNNRNKVIDFYKLDAGKPIVLVTGGGTGALSINRAMEIIGEELSDIANIIHLTGKGKMTDYLANAMPDNYIALEFLGEGMLKIISAADIVVSRAGMGTIMELAFLKKPSIILPLPNQDQLNNARALQERGAAIVLDDFNPQILKQNIKTLLYDKQLQSKLSKEMGRLFPVNGAVEVAHLATDIIKIKK
ncbi:UDP-N-acetylglucosamine--N-acetylmuramyl-(pentapeptide) pyrophosphoryl-undecaprenol N-acetylglucosamine transferase [Candidatus Parcubacteria bacterium]|nr:MAG: UDP-N-acetylglucosamine--N-acetylmuramyl-(pentapeptide) pyrophosphoryl-undecaprenol N-acetylglucosamine transferase [Candidatus Parcubacteria bacterium]